LEGVCCIAQDKHMVVLEMVLASGGAAWQQLANVLRQVNDRAENGSMDEVLATPGGWMVAAGQEDGQRQARGMAMCIDCTASETRVCMAFR
jgi:hypothetical protein